MLWGKACEAICSTYSELCAIALACDLLEAINIRGRVMIFSDSQAALSLISNNTDDSNYASILKCIMMPEFEPIFKWIKGHVGTFEPEVVDQAEKVMCRVPLHKGALSNKGVSTDAGFVLERGIRYLWILRGIEVHRHQGAIKQYSFGWISPLSQLARLWGNGMLNVERLNAFSDLRSHICRRCQRWHALDVFFIFRFV